MKKYGVLAAAVVLIILAIWYLEKMKPQTGPVVPVAVGAHSMHYVANSLTYPVAKEFVSPDGYINTPDGGAITLSDLINKNHNVVLVDFWTYSCINCQRTIPYLEAWYQKYKDSGLVIVGVHAPEFAFEKVLANVQAGVKKFGITYPVVMDSNMGTWNAYNNQYWPAEYLVDVDGLVREHSIGEGNYKETEGNIQKLLAERNELLGLTTPIPTGFVDISQSIQTASPETYFGYGRNEYLGNGKQQTPGSQTFVPPVVSAVEPNTLYLGGTWNFQGEFAENTSASASIVYHYSAKSVYLVASSQKGVTLTILLDGKPIDTIHVQEARLYTLVQSASQEEHIIEIRISGAGLDAYTFTFG